MQKFQRAHRSRFIVLFVLATTVGAFAQSFDTLVQFSGQNGSKPTYGALIQGTDGRFYGTTGFGGSGGNLGGTVFAISAAGELSTIYNFCVKSNCADGDYPFAGLVMGRDGSFYGTTGYGGVADYCPLEIGQGCGTIFTITPAGDLRTLYSFCYQSDCPDGLMPQAGLTWGANGYLYGTTSSGGAENSGGTIFKFAPAGGMTTLYSFCSKTNCVDGSAPVGGLVQANNGNFYGTTTGGGLYNNAGTVFEITPSGTLTTLHSFCAEHDGAGSCSDGELPYATLVQGTSGKLYGTTAYGGAHGYGTVFEMTLSGELTTLYSFCARANCADGASPEAALVEANGNFYGTTGSGGALNCLSAGEKVGCGTAFEITPTGKFTLLHTFCEESNCPDGEFAFTGLMQTTAGPLLGTTSYGGGSSCDHDQGCGTIFSLSLGLPPFAETVPTSGTIGKTVVILGNDLTTTTAVIFNGVSAQFSIVSDTEIMATVPAGASSGPVQVNTSKGSLTTNASFRVLP